MNDLFEKYGLQGIASTLRRRVLPAVAFSLTEERTTRSAFGGAPLTPSDFEWPSYTPPPRRYPPTVLSRLGIPAPPDPAPRTLDFLLQIDLADIRLFSAAKDLPQSGLLTFFYDSENNPWGFDPVHQDGFRVMLFEEDDLAARLPANRPLEPRGVKFSQAETLPHFCSRAYEELVEEVDLTDTYFEFVQEFEKRAYHRESGLHRLLGHSANVQGDMQLEAQLVPMACIAAMPQATTIRGRRL